MRILLVEPYFTGSHRAWAEGYVAASRHRVELVTMEGQFWRWRMTGAHLQLSERIAAWVAANGRPDAMLATSMVNLSTLLAHTRGTLNGVPVALYMHENQLTYIDRTRPADYSFAAINWASMTAADLVMFNSEYHRRSWFTAARTWLGSYADHSHDQWLDSVEADSRVVPVGVDLRRLDGAAQRAQPPLILWNHRADADKQPEVFVAAMLELAQTGRQFRVAIAGERFVDSGSVFDPLGQLGSLLEFNGFADDVTYAELLRSTDIVVSTALQEFFGISITEAVYCGAFPVIPHRVVYPERIPEEHHERCLYQPGRLVRALQWALDHAEERRPIAAHLRGLMAQADWAQVAPQLDALMDGLRKVR